MVGAVVGPGSGHVKLRSLTLRIDVRPPPGIRGSVLEAGSVVELALLEHPQLGRCYLARVEGHRPRYYLPAAVDSVELPDEEKPAARSCTICGAVLPAKARGLTCSYQCRRTLGHRRHGR